MRIYYEVVRSNDLSEMNLWKVTVPVGLSFFPKEQGYSPRASDFHFCAKAQFEIYFRYLRAESNIVFESEHDAGGHFAAYEKPEAITDDLRRMFGKGGPAAGVVAGHDGF